MTEDSRSLPPWEPTELDREIRYWIDFFTGPPTELTEAERETNARLVAFVHEQLRRLRPVTEPTTTAATEPVPAVTPPSAPPAPPVTVRQVLDALDRLALRCLAASTTDPFDLATALRVLDGATAIRGARGLERRAIVDIGDTTWEVAKEVFDTVHFQVLAEPIPTWATVLAASLERIRARTTLDPAQPPPAAPVRPPTPEPPPADNVISYLNIARGLEVGHLEALIAVDELMGGDVGVLEGLEAVARLRLSTGITRDQEDDLRREAAGARRA